MAEHARRFDELTSLGYGLVALSVDPPEVSRALAERLELPFPLVSDGKREVVRAFDLYNAKEQGGIAYPATFVLDRERVVRFRSLDRAASRVELGALFAFLRGEEASAAEPPRARIVPGFRDWGRAIRSALRYGTKAPRT